MKKLYLLLIIICGMAANSQNLICEKTTDYYAINFEENFAKHYEYYIFQKKLFLCDQFNVQVLDSNLRSRSFDLLKLNKEIKKSLFPAYGYDYFFDGQKLIIKNRYLIFCFTYNGKDFLFEKQFKLNNKYGKYIYFRDNKIILYEIYNHHPKSENFKSGYLTVDFTTGQETLKTIDFDYFAITHFQPNKFLDFSKNSYILCDPFKYTIKEYNYRDNEISKITAEESVFTVSKKTLNFSDSLSGEAMLGNPSSHFDHMNHYVADIDRIWIACFIDSNTIFVRLTRNSLNQPGENNQIFYDHIWKRTANGWELKQVKSLSSPNLQTEIVQKDLWPYFFPGSKLVFCDNSLYYVVWSASSNVLPQEGQAFYGTNMLDKKNVHLKILKFKSTDNP